MPRHRFELSCKLRHLRRALLISRPGRFIRALVERLETSQAQALSAAVTYNLLFALFPFLIFLVELMSFFIDPDSLDLLLDQLSLIAPKQVVDLLHERLQSLMGVRSRQLLTLSALVTIFSASSGVSALQNALNRIFEIAETRPVWRTRLICLGVTLGLAGFILVGTLLALFTPLILNWIDLGHLDALVHLASLPFAGLLVALAFSTLLHVLPDARTHLPILSPGALIAVAAWMALSWGFSIYVQNFGRYEVTYGTLGGVVIFLAWLKLSVDAFLVGAAFDAERYRGRLEHPRRTRPSHSSGAPPHSP